MSQKNSRAGGIEPDRLGGRGADIHRTRRMAIDGAIRNAAAMHEAAPSWPAPCRIRFKLTTKTLLLNAGIDIIWVKQKVGHGHVTTNQMHDRRRQSLTWGPSCDVPI
jgi:hypothetical protein